MTNRDVVVVGASAGGVEALRALVSGLPRTLRATVLVVLHLPPGGRSWLPSILTRAGLLPARHPLDGEALPAGEILVAPPDHHLYLEDGLVRLTHGPSENGHRPAVDPLFRSAARWYGSRVIGVVLSGTLDDGTSGEIAVGRFGGVTIVQDPEDALYPGMPRSVLDHLDVDYVLPVAQIGPLLGRLCAEEDDDVDDPGPSADLVKELDVVDERVPAPLDPPGTPAGLGCVTCGGSLFEISDGDLLRYRCRVGHAWSPESLLVEQSEALEGALWLGLRTLEDRAALCRRSEAAARHRGHTHTAERYRVLADEAGSAARVLRGALEKARLDAGPSRDSAHGPGAAG